MTLGGDRRLKVSVANMEDNVQKKLKQAITVRLAETREHVETELPEYIMSMITNKKSKNYMHKNLEAFIGEDAMIFCDWVFNLVEKINDNCVSDLPRSSESEGDVPDSGSYPANIIKNVKEEKEKESRSKPSSSGTHRESDRSRADDSRKRKVEEERKARVPIEAPRRDGRRIFSRKESERDRERIREKERERERDRHRVIRKEGRDRGRDRSGSPRRIRHSESHRESASHRKPIKFDSSASEMEEDDDEDVPQNTVASKVVAKPQVVKTPTVSSQVTVKRNVRKMGDEKLMKARSSMFLKALTDASHSTSGEPSTKAARIVERMDSSSDSKAPTGSIEERIVRVRIDVSKPPTKRMEQRLRRIKEQKEAVSKEINGKRKHDEIVFDLPEDDPALDDDRILHLPEDDDDDYETEIDKIIEETKAEEMGEPLTKRVANHVDFVANEEEDMDMGQMKKKIRCSFWPKCTRGDSCHFLHPNAVCTAFPKCTFGQKCHYIHPPCRFAGRCLNTKCAYTHGDPEVMNMLSYYFPSHMLAKPKPAPAEIFPEIEPDIPLSNAPRRIGVLCRYADTCLNPNCKYDHPQLCRFGDQCINEKCGYFHPPAPLPKAAMKKTNPSLYKWSATNNS